MEKSFVKTENERLLNSILIIHWWNFGKKTSDFKGKAKEFLEEHKVNYKIEYYQDTNHNFERCFITCNYSLGHLQEVILKVDNMEDFIRMIVNIQLSYLGDKSIFKFNNRTRTINF